MPDAAEREPCGLSPWIEEKPGGLALRLDGFSPDDALMLGARLWRPWSRITSRYGLRILDLKHGIELRIAGPTRKQAVETILSELPGHTPMAYIGTDVLDEPAFGVLEQRGLRISFGVEKTSAGADIALRS